MYKHYAVLALLLASMESCLRAAVIELKTMKDYKELCTQNKPFVLMFYAPWCSACSGMKEPYNQVSGEIQDVLLAKVNIETAELKSLIEAFCVTSVPTFVTRQSGMMSKDALTTLVKGHIRQPLPQKSPAQGASAKPEAKKATA